MPFGPLDPVSGIGLFRIPDPKSRIPDPKLIFLELSYNFLDKKFHNSLKIGPNFFLEHFKSKIILHCEICGYKKMFKNFFHPSFVAFLDPESGIRDG